MNVKTLTGKPIDIKCRETWRWPTATLRIPHDTICGFAPVRKPCFGDVALCQVTSIGSTSFIENKDGCNMSIFANTLILGVFAPRYAADEFEGEIPSTLKAGDEICLLNRGGTIGNVKSKNSQFGEPTKVVVLSFLKDKDGEILNTLNYGKVSNRTINLNPEVDRNLIVVVGTSMNAGKSSTAKAVVYGLAANGHSVVAGKTTGQAARRDSLLMKSAGASEVTDFVDYGYPSTYMLPQHQLNDLFWDMYGDLHQAAGPGGYIVLEFADGIYQRETAMLLSNMEIKRRISHVVFSCCDSLSAVAGVKTLRRAFGLETTAISGPAANSGLGLSEVGQFLPRLPAFNNMVMDSEVIASLFTEKRPSGNAMIKRASLSALVEKRFGQIGKSGKIVTAPKSPAHLSS